VELVFLLVGLAVGGIAVWLVLRARIVAPGAELEHERRAVAGQTTAREQLEASLKALVAALQRDARDDLESRQRSVERLIAPLKESLEKVTSGLQELERGRSAASGALSAQIRDLVEAQARLQSETANLSSALRASGARGRWGEVQLRRVVELAGMLSYCDFVEQRTYSAGERVLRPDLVVRMPGGRNIVIDAKAPFDAYIQASNAETEELKRARLAAHARAVRDHVAKLSAKAYWEPFEPTPGFVVLFVPAEPLFHAALEHDPGLIEDAARQGVLLTSPASLIALLRSVAEGWRQEKVAESARTVSELGKQLYERLGTLAGHVARLGKSLDNAVGAYNDAVGSLESRVLVTARQFPDLGVAAAKEIGELEPVQRMVRASQAPELTTPAPSGPQVDPADASIRPAARGSDADDVPDAA
jgi:DNA recombination protein RmuC